MYTTDLISRLADSVKATDLSLNEALAQAFVSGMSVNNDTVKKAETLVLELRESVVLSDFNAAERDAFEALAEEF